MVHYSSFCVGGLLAVALAASAETYPNRPITMVVPAPPAGASDTTARAIAIEMAKGLGQPVIIENKGGASGMVGAQAVARAAPDGYTVLLTYGLPILNAPFVFAKVPYDPKKDFTFVSEVAKSDLVLFVNKDVPAKNMKEFMTWATANRGKLSYGSFGTGGVGHLMSAYLVESRHLDMTHVPYKGEAPLVQDVMSGNVPWGMTSLATVGPQIASGRVRPIAVVGQARFETLPDVPTMAEAGFPDEEFKAVGWVGLLAPAGTPAPVVARLEKEVRAAIQSASVRARFQDFGFRPIGSTSQEFRQSFDRSLPLMEKLVKLSGVKPE